MLPEIDRVLAEGAHPEDASRAVGQVPGELRPSAALGVVAALLMGVMLGIVLGLRMQRGSQKLERRLDGYRDALHLLRPG